MAGHPDKFVCLEISEFDKEKIVFPEPKTILLEHGGEYKQIIPTYIDGYLQTEFCEVYFYRGIFAIPEDEKRNVRTTAFTLTDVPKKYVNFLSQISRACDEVVVDLKHHTVKGPILSHGDRSYKEGAGKKVNAKYFEYTREKTQIIGPNGSLLDFNLFIQKPFRAIPILRFDLVGHQNQYVVRALIVSMIITDFEIEMGPEIHQNTLSKFTSTQISQFEEKYQKLQTRGSKSLSSPRRYEKEKIIEMPDKIRENPKNMKPKEEYYNRVREYAEKKKDEKIKNRFVCSDDEN